MRTNNRFKLTCYYVRGEVEVPVFETSSFQQLELLVRRKAKGLLCYKYDASRAIQRDYLSIQIRRWQFVGEPTTELCRYSLSLDGNELWAY